MHNNNTFNVCFNEMFVSRKKKTVINQKQFIDSTEQTTILFDYNYYVSNKIQL